MLFIKSKDMEKFTSTKCLPPDENSSALKIKRDNYIIISYSSFLNPIFVPPPATDYVWEDDNGHIWPIWTEDPPIPPIREQAQDVPITFIANEDIEIVELYDGEYSENDDEVVSTDLSDNDDSNWELSLEYNCYYHITNTIIDIINDKLLLIMLVNLDPYF